MAICWSKIHLTNLPFRKQSLLHSSVRYFWPVKDFLKDIWSTKMEKILNWIFIQANSCCLSLLLLLNAYEDNNTTSLPLSPFWMCLLYKCISVIQKWKIKQKWLQLRHWNEMSSESLNTFQQCLTARPKKVMKWSRIRYFESEWDDKIRPPTSYLDLSCQICPTFILFSEVFSETIYHAQFLAPRMESM